MQFAVDRKGNVVDRMRFVVDRMQFVVDRRANVVDRQARFVQKCQLLRPAMPAFSFLEGRGYENGGAGGRWSLAA